MFLKITSILLCTLVLFSFNIKPIYADCKQPVTHLLKEEVTPCEGYLFSPEKELEIRIKNEEYKLLMEQTKIYIQRIELYKEQVKITEEIAKKEAGKAELWRDRAEDITEKYVKQNNRQGWRDWVFFGAGILTTAIAAWTVSQTTK